MTLEDAEIVVGKVQGWFSEWAAAPVFYIDQGIINRTGVYVGRDRSKGVAIWLRAMAKCGVEVVLIDTVDKARSWKLVRTGNDPKGLLSLREISELAGLGQKLGIKVLWAGGITGPQAYQLGKLGVFGIYVTTAAAMDVAVVGTYLSDPGMAKAKRPTFSGVLSVKTLLEAGYLSERVKFESTSTAVRPANDGADDKLQGLDLAGISRALPKAWRQWWRAAK